MTSNVCLEVQEYYYPLQARREDGDCAVELTEVAPGIDAEKDILAHMDFRPVMNIVKLMDARCFLP